MDDRPTFSEAIDRAVIANYALKLHAERLRSERSGKGADDSEPPREQPDTDETEA